MFKHNAKLQVHSDHRFHPRRIGYFQFLSGVDNDIVVLTAEPVIEEENKYSHTWFAVGKNDVQEI